MSLYRNMALRRIIVSFATDSIITIKKLGVNSSKLGGFAYENSGDDVYVLQNGASIGLMVNGRNGV